MADIRIRGAKSGQKQPRKPNISKDTAASISTAKLLYGMAEGEVYGLADGAKSIRLEGTPLVDDAGNPNFEGVTWDFRNGSNDQEYIKGFPDVSNETPINVELRSSQPWIKAFNDTQISAVRVRFKWNRLSQTNSENGDVTGYKIDYAIDLQTDGGAYQTVLTTKIQDKTSAGYERTHRIDLPKAKTGWQLRVRRITPNSTSDLIQDTMMIDAVAEVIDVKLSYPNTALLGVQYNAELFSNIAKMSVRLKGKIIRVPDNYDPVARTYTGIWTGNFKDAYSNNPAWVFYDLCTQWRGGLGERLDATMIDRWSLYALGQYCDQPVSDGQGGLEPRFTCNVYLQKQEEAYTVLQNIAGIFRAMSFWTGERIMLDADVPQDPIYTYSSANIVGGVAGIQYSGTRNRDRHTLAKVAWDNPNNDYQTEYEYVRDEKAMSKFGVKVLDLSAFGCTSQAQAQRAGLWALKTEQLETRQVTFSVGLDGAIPRVGNIISLSDEAFAGRANGGRVSTVNATQRIIELDREVTASVGDVLIINGGSGKSERRNISNVVGNRITVTAGFTSAEPEHVWAIETAGLKLMRFRVMSITENDDATYAITAIQHEPQKYDAIDFGTDVKPTDITIVNPDTVDAPDTVSIESRHREVQGQTITTLIIGWAQVSGAVAYDVEWRKDDGTWIKLPRTGNVSAEIDGVYSGNYMARVRAVSAFDVQSQATTSILTEVKGKIGLPPTVVGLTATGVLFGMDLKWGFQAGSGDAAFTEIQVGSAPNVNVATLTQVSYPTNTHTVTGLQGNLKQSYRARLVDKMGFKSPWSAWVTGTTDASADKVMDLIQGQINESSLNQALTSKIEKIDTNSSSISGINTELDKAKADITAADKVIAANKLEAANAVAAANKAIADNKLIASNAVAAANAEIAASKVIIDSNKAEISAAKTELNTAKTQLATAIADIGTANTKIADSKTLIDANKAKLVLTDAEVAAAKTKVTALETDYNGNKTSVSNALTVLTNKDKSLASDLSTLTASYGASEAKLVQDLKVLTDKDVALTNSVTTLSSSYEANKTKVATDITTLVNKDTALNNLLTTLDSDYKTNKASVSNSLTTLTNKDTSLASDISKLNTKTDNTNAEIVTVKNIVSDNTSSIANTKTDITAEYKQAIDDIEIGGRNLIIQKNITKKRYVNHIDGVLYSAGHDSTDFIPVESGKTYTLSADGYLYYNRAVFYDADKAFISGIVGGAKETLKHITPPLEAAFLRISSDINSGATSDTWKLEKGNKATDFTLAPEDVEADYNAKISTEATARADADKVITSSVTSLKSDYDANKASVTQSLGTLTTKDTALTNQLSALTSTVGTNTANITANNNTLVAKDKAIADSVTALDAKYEDNKTFVSNQLSALVNKDTATANQLTALDTDYKGNKTTVSNSLTALSNADTALGSRITTLDTDYKGNKTAIRTELTAVSNKANSTANSLTSLTTEVGKNATAISTEATTRSTEDTALSNRITTVSGKTDNALSRITTAETTIANNTGAITQQKTDITAAYKQAIDDIDLNNANYMPSEFLNNPENWIRGTYYKANIVVDLEPNTTYTVRVGELLPYSGHGVFNILDGTDSVRRILRAVFNINANKILREDINTTFITPESGKITFDIYYFGYLNPNFIKRVQINKGTTKQDWIPSFIDAELKTIANTASIAAESIARSDADTSLGSRITTLTTTVGGNTTKISQETTARSTADTALGKRITDTDAIAKNAQSRVGTAETAISNATSAIAQQKTEVEAKFNNLANKNLIENGTFAVGQSVSPWSISTSTRVVGEASHDGTLNAIRLGVSVSNSYMLASKLFKELGYHTLSFWIKGNKAGSLNVQMQDQVHLKVTPVTTSWVKHTFSANITSLSTLYSVVFGGWSSWTDLSLQVSLSNIELTKDSASVDDAHARVTAEATARSDADTALGNRITTLDTDYQGNKTAIRTELTAVSNKANSTANSLSTLTTTVGGNTTKISQESTARSSADTALGNRITATEAVANNAQSRVGTAETAISNATSAIATLRTDLTASYNIQDTRGTNELPSYYYTNYPRQTVREFKQKSVMTGVVGTGTYVYLETVVRWSSVSGGAIVQTAVTDDNRIYIRTSSSATAWRAWVEQEDVTGSAAKVAALKTALDKDIKAVDARVTSEKTVAANATSAVAKTVGTLTTTVNGHTSSIQTQQTSINGLNAQYTVKLDVGGRVSGFGLASSATQSDFAVNADKFYVAPPTGSAKGVSPFMVLTSSKTINGTSVPAGTYIESAFIHNGSIDTAKIKDLSVSTGKIANLAVSTAKIANLAVKSAQIDNLAVTTGKIANLSVDTLQIKGNAVTAPLSAWFAGRKYLQGWDNGGYWVEHTLDIFTLTVPANVPKVIITFNAVQIFHSANAGVEGTGSVQLLRDGEVIRDVPLFRSLFVNGVVPAGNKLNYPTLISITDNPKATGSVYTVRFYIHAKRGQLHIEGEGFSFSVLGAKK